MSAWASAADYTFPFEDPFVATVVGTPRDVAAEPKPLRGANVKRVHLEVFPEREKPEVFWYDRGLRTAVVYQKHRARTRSRFPDRE